MKIAVDAMGGDYAPAAIVAGAGLAARQLADHGGEIILVGIEDVVRAELDRQNLRLPNISIHHAPEVVAMNESPRLALRQKVLSSVTVSVDLVRDGLADAAISAGNSGAMMAAATMRLRCLPGVQRPAIAVAMPTPIGKRIVLDAGANVDCKPEHLADFALMGSVYAEHALKVERPRVGLLSIGTEDSKGNELTLEAFRLCKLLDLNFVGNVEGHDLFRNHVDVVVCDGFVGNIVLKTCESLALAMFSMLKRELTANPRRQLGALLARNAFRAIKRRMDPEGFGGAPLLGFNGTVMKAHGSARERAIANAIKVTTENIQHHVNQTIAQEIARANERLSAGEAVAAAAL